VLAVLPDLAEALEARFSKSGSRRHLAEALEVTKNEIPDRPGISGGS